MNNFYATFPSDKSHDRSVVNTVGNFTFTLPEPKCLEGKWCVALAELIYPMSIMNFPAQEEITFGIINSNGKLSVLSNKIGTLEVGTYKSEEFVRAIQDVFTN